MTTWRIWLAAGVGVAPARDVLAAEAGIDGRIVRQVRRLMRRGRVAPDVPRARLAVALARDAQRRRSNPSLTVFFAALVVGWVWLFVERISGGHIDLLTVFWGGAAAWGIYVLWVLRRTRTGAPRAELRNLRFLREAGEPYGNEAERGPTRVPMPALVASTLTAFAFYDVAFGALTLAMDGRALSVSSVVGHGAGFATVITVFNMTLMRSRNNQQRLRSTAGHDG